MKLSRKLGHNVTARVSFPFRDEGTHRPVLIAGRINESRARRRVPGEVAAGINNYLLIKALGPNICFSGV